MNPDATNMSPLADIKGVRLLTRKSDDAIYKMSDGGDLVEGSYQWVWNVATDPQGAIPDLRWWIGEVLAPKKQTALTLAEVIEFILPKSRREFPAGEVRSLLLVSRPTLMELRAELLGDLRAGGSFYPRSGLVKFLSTRWLGRADLPVSQNGAAQQHRPTNNFHPAHVAEERDNRRGKSGELAKAISQSPHKALSQSLKRCAVAG